MTKPPRNPNGSRPTLTVAASNTPESVALTTLVKQAASNPKAAKLPAATFSPEALSKLLNELTEQRKAMALLMAEHAELKAKVDQPAKMSVAGKTEKSIKNEIATVKAFAKAGFKDAKPHVNVKTFNKWMLEDLRPKEGSKSVRIANLRLFHRSQCRRVTAAEKAASKAQSRAAVDRHEGNPNLEVQ